VLYFLLQDFPNWRRGYIETFIVVIKKLAVKENAKLILFLTTRQKELIKPLGKIYIICRKYIPLL
jgi:hypothetical protein